MPNKQGRASSITSCGATTESRSAVVEAKRTKRDPRGPAAGEALRRLPGEEFGAAAGDFLLQRLRALDVGRYALSAARSPGLPQQGRTGAADPAAQHAQALAPTDDQTATIVERYYQTRAIRRIGEASRRTQRKALLVMATAPARRDGDRARRPADARQLGQARAVPCRPGGAGQPGVERLQGAPARIPRRSTWSPTRTTRRPRLSSRPIRP